MSGSPVTAQVLTARECAAVPLLVQDCSLDDLAARLQCSPAIAADLRACVYEKLSVHDRGELMEWAIKQGVL